jgi:hypothetical protein
MNETQSNDTSDSRSSKNDAISLLYKMSGKPLADRSETVKVMKAILGESNTEDSTSSKHLRRVGESNPEDSALSSEESNTESSTSSKPPRPPVSNVYGEGPMLVSDIPDSCRKEGVIVGSKYYPEPN